MKKDGFLGWCDTVRHGTFALAILVLVISFCVVYEIGGRLMPGHILLMMGTATLLLVPTLVVAWYEVLVTTNPDLIERHNECGNCGD